MKKGDQITSFYRCADDGEVSRNRYSEEDHSLSYLECVKLMEDADSWDWVPEGMLDYVCDYLDLDVEKYIGEEIGVDNDGLFTALYKACAEKQSEK